MNTAIAIERCRSFIDCHLQTKNRPPVATHPLQQEPAITISRQTGSGAFVVGEKLAACLQAKDSTATCPWTVMDHQLAEKVLDEHNLPKKFAQFMPEEKLSFVEDMMEEVLGLHPSSWTLARKTMETILHLAQMGHVILVGWGANLITAKMPNVFHVRLVGTLEKRIEHLQKAYNFSARDAAEFVKKTDRGRVRYIKQHFNCDVDDPLAYHMVVNTSRMSFDDTARVIADAALRHFEAYAASFQQEGTVSLTGGK